MGKLLAGRHELGVSAGRLLQLGIGYQRRQTPLGASLVEQAEDLLFGRHIVALPAAPHRSRPSEENCHQTEENAQAIHSYRESTLNFYLLFALPKHYNPDILGGGMLWAQCS